MTIDEFMRRLFGQESGGDYTATNPDSGAYGKYQIMPSNWPSWAAEAGIPGQPPTPENQERVARFKIQQYYNTFGNWADVASVWYSGRPISQMSAEEANAPQNGYPSIRSYVDSVLGGSQMADPDFYNEYTALIAQRDALLDQFGPLEDKMLIIEGLGNAVTYLPGVGFVATTEEPVLSYGQETGEFRRVADRSTVYMTEAEYQSFYALDRQLGEVEDRISLMDEQYAGGEDVNDAIRRGEYGYNTDPRVIDAQNKANQYARDYTARQDAARMAADKITEQRLTQQAALDSFNEVATSPSAFGKAFMAPRTHMPSADDLFKESLDTITKGLPEVPGLPYYSDSARNLPGLKTPLPTTSRRVTQGAYGHPGAKGILPQNFNPNLPATVDPDTIDAVNDWTTLPGGITSTASGLPGSSSVAAPKLPTTTATKPKATAILPTLPDYNSQRRPSRSERVFRGSILAGGN